MKIRDRIKELRRVKAANLVPNPRNWRTHPQAQQDALRGLLSEVGYADALLCREDADGRLVLIDGHLRAETTPEQKVPVLVLDVTEEEADKLLLTLDPLAAMAEASQAAREALKDHVAFRETQLQELFGSEDADRETLLKAVEVKPPPKMTWILIGIPTVKYGNIAERIESLATEQEAIIEMTANDG